MVQQAKLERRISASATLRNMIAGERVRIPTKHIKTVSIRSAAYRLEKSGYKFHVTETGLINETQVACLKSPIKN